MSIQDQIAKVFQEMFGNDEIVYNAETSPKDIPMWDSVSHVSMILAIEKKFGIKFTTREIVAIKKMGDIFDAIERKTAKSSSN